jgi:small subunit ribosomal protein S1
MNEQIEQSHLPEEQNAPSEEVVLPPLITTPVEQAEETPVEPVEVAAAEEPAEVAAAEEPAEVAAAEEPAEVAAAEEPAVSAEQQAAEEETFDRPRTLRDLKPGMVLEGKVTSVAIYGVFVDIGVGREGLVPLGQLSDHPVSSPTDVVQIGDMVSVRVVKVDLRSKRISLSMREPAAERHVDAAKLDELTPGTIVEGTVASLTKFGAFVDIGVGRDGLIPLSQMAQGKTEPLQVGDQVRVRVMDVDKKSSRIRLSMRNVHDTEQLAALRSGAIVQGKITSLAAFGAFVDLGVGKDGLIHVSTMGEGGVHHPREVVQVGQEVEVRILEVDPQTQRISLTMQLEEEEPEEPWVPEPEEEEEPMGEATLEDLAARFNKMRAGGSVEPTRGTSQAEREKRALRDALRRTLDAVKDK